MADGLAISMDIVDVSLILVGLCVSGARLCSIAIGGHEERNQVATAKFCVSCVALARAHDGGAATTYVGIESPSMRACRDV